MSASFPSDTFPTLACSMKAPVWNTRVGIWKLYSILREKNPDKIFSWVNFRSCDFIVYGQVPLETRVLTTIVIFTGKFIFEQDIRTYFDLESWAGRRSTYLQWYYFNQIRSSMLIDVLMCILKHGLVGTPRSRVP